MTPAPPGLLDKLPEHYRLDLQRLAVDRLTPVGRQRDLQAMIDRHFAVIEALLNDGLDYGDLAQILAELGITRPTGAAYGRNTLSSAVHRHLLRHAAANGRRRRRTAASHSVQPAAAPVSADFRISALSKDKPPTTPSITAPDAEPQSETRRAARLINLIGDPS